MSDDSQSSNRPARFVTTQWSLIASAGDSLSPSAANALQTLCQTYWLPLYAFATRKADTVHDAQDMTQAFFVELLENNYVATAQQERGKFRSFILTAFKNFMSKNWQKKKAQKRGGNVTHLSLDFQSADSNIGVQVESGLTAQQLFDQQWAIALLEQILDRLKKEYVKSGESERFQLLKSHVIGDYSGSNYVETARLLGISEAAVKKTVSRMRARYREILRDEIAQTVTTVDEIDEEIRSLFNVLNGN